MNDRPSSGPYPDAGYDGLSTTTFAGDPYGGPLQGGFEGTYENQHQTQGYGFAYDPYGTYGTQQTYDTGAYDSSAWSQSSQEAYLAAIPAQTASEDTTGQWDASAWNAGAAHQSDAFGYGTAGQDASGHWEMPSFATGTETGSYDATAWNGAVAEELPQQYVPSSYGYDDLSAPEAQTPYGHSADPYETYHPGHGGLAGHTVPGQAVSYEEYAEDHAGPDTGGTAVFEDVTDDAPGGHDDPAAPEAHPAEAGETAPHPAPRSSRSARRGAPAAPAAGGRAASRRNRTPAKRSALLTVAVPSACVMGVAGVAAASVGGLTGGQQPAEDTTTLAAPDPASVKPVAANSKLDTQLAALSADAGDFADRASRTQERIDLRARQEAERKKRAEEAARKEAMRPKFALPVAQHGLSAGYGQSGVNWMSLHTGIDFPVSYGTPVMAATDGTVRTQWNSAYGNMAIVTAPDGTETWYCHLSSTKLRSGSVKAGDVIAYSGNSGNSTGPHLHFEVRPGGGSAINPLTWLRSHGLDPM
ncbi:M23 family metallopeptidase [Streptomyces bambusae]|uniref:M23 family metallopeptidase n=1 Tax=Streptomyces bambusae TaxID=1550616 RepID=UPI001CFC5FD1|nr:M23 family metallopeptidase [Streptomyces bambusae]MCB5165874.1 M23 family metallopeptidase [Streptomyces bambusae]